MERELKAKLEEAIAGAIDWYEKRPKAASIDSRSESKDSKSGSIDSKTKSTDTEPKALRLARSVKTKMEKQGIWTEVQSQLALDAIAAGVQRELEKINRAAIDDAQLTLPGFDHLPNRIGKKSIADTSVKGLFAFYAKYQERQTHDMNVLAELKALTDKLKPYTVINPKLSVGEALAQIDAPQGLALVKSAAAK